MKETLLSGKRFSVERCLVTLPSGRETDWDIIRHPGAVVILPILDDESIVLIRNYRPCVGKTLLELPAGTLEVDEDPGECASREVEEETGYRAGSIEPLGEMYTSPGILDERMYAFVARDLKAVGQNLDTYEEITVEAYSLDKIRRMLLDGELVDAKTIAVLATYILKQERE